MLVSMPDGETGATGGTAAAAAPAKAPAKGASKDAGASATSSSNGGGNGVAGSHPFLAFLPLDCSPLLNDTTAVENNYVNV